MCIVLSDGASATMHRTACLAKDATCLLLVPSVGVAIGVAVGAAVAVAAEGWLPHLFGETTRESVSLRIVSVQTGKHDAIKCLPAIAIPWYGREDGVESHGIAHDEVVDRDKGAPLAHGAVVIEMEGAFVESSIACGVVRWTLSLISMSVNMSRESCARSIVICHPSRSAGQIRMVHE